MALVEMKVYEGLQVAPGDAWLSCCEQLQRKGPDEPFGFIPSQILSSWWAGGSGDNIAELFTVWIQMMECDYF